MKYLSTRGAAPTVSFEEALLQGLAPDGGLYMPSFWRPFHSYETFARASYSEAAAAIIAPYLDEGANLAALKAAVEQAYANFDHPEIAPLREIGDDLYILELFHGPTLAFKDFAMQVLSRLMEKALKRRGAKTTILGATSGDTGAAAVEAFRGREDIELFILFPHGRISDVQRRQMTTATEDNVHVIAIEGSFDDAQAIVKSLFTNAEFRERHRLSAINSINWARIIAQAVYYFTSAAKLGHGANPAFCVPTGNFGDVFAGYTALRMGLPISKLVVATNENDILARTLAHGRYEPMTVQPTDSPSMDIQISSNFERLLFEASGRDAAFVRNSMSSLAERGWFDIPERILSSMREHFVGCRASRAEAASAMAELFSRTGYLIDPHTAVGLAAASKARKESSVAGPMVVLATAHPAKFPEAVQRATGQIPTLPDGLRRRLRMDERLTVLPNSAAVVADFIQTRAAHA